MLMVTQMHLHSQVIGYMQAYAFSSDHFLGAFPQSDQSFKRHLHYQVIGYIVI